MKYVQTLRSSHALGATVMMAESSCRTEDLKQSEGGIFMAHSEGIADTHEEYVLHFDRFVSVSLLGFWKVQSLL